MDIHTVDPKTTWEDVAGAHKLDVEFQDAHGVDYLKYWFNKDCGKLFCLVDAPSAEAAHCVHRKSHGLLAEKLIEVDPDLMDSFMGAAPANEAGAAVLPGPDSQRDPGVRTILFTDIVGSTEMCSRHGDDAAMTMLAVHDRVVRDALDKNDGREIKHTGDGIMAAFASAASAVRAACAVQRDLGEHNDKGAELPVVVRIGLTAGEPVERSDDLFGSTVQLAARLCARAEPGQVLVSNVVADLCLGKGLKFHDAGSHEMKGFEQPVHTHAVEIIC